MEVPVHRPVKPKVWYCETFVSTYWGLISSASGGILGSGWIAPVYSPCSVRYIGSNPLAGKRTTRILC